MIRRRYLVYFALLATCGCGDVLAPPPSAVPLHPLPEEYTAWWTLTERCAGVERRLDRVRFMVVPEPTIPGTEDVTGAWYRDVNTIVFAGGRERIGSIVRHEMLHAIVDRTDHPRSAFVDRCAGIVSCEGACIREAGGPIVRDPSAPIVPPEAMDISVDVEPREVQRNTDASWPCVTVVVSARNPAGSPSRAQLQLVEGLAQSFGYVLNDGADGELEFSPSDFMAFAGNETRRSVYECAAVGDVPGQAPLAHHEIRGLFGGILTDPVRIDVIR